MRIYNKTNIIIPKPLFRVIAEKFALNGNLLRATNDKYGLYGTKQLKVVIQYAEQQPAYTQTCGYIELNCCSKCSSSFVIYNFIEALLHECLFQLVDHNYYPAPSTEEDDLCKNLALKLFNEGFVFQKALKVTYDIKCHHYPTIIDNKNKFNVICEKTLSVLGQFAKTLLKLQKN